MISFKLLVPILFNYQRIFLLGLMSVFWASLSLPSQPDSCIPLSLIGGKGHEVEKKVTIPAIPGIFAHNWNTDWSIPNYTRFHSYKAVVVSEQGGIFDVKMYLKYSDETADPFYEQSNLELDAGVPLNIDVTSRRREQPYQVNLLVGGVKATGNKYRASVYACH
jgi:hypothetical protein